MIPDLPLSQVQNLLSTTFALCPGDGAIMW